MPPTSFPRRRLLELTAILLAILADAYVLRHTWTGLQVVEGQLRRGYFESFAGRVGIALDPILRPVFPSLALTDDGALAVPPGMTAAVPLEGGLRYRFECDWGLAPYLVLGRDGPVGPAAGNLGVLVGEAQLSEPRTLSISAGRLSWTPWDGSRPWREDAARLTALVDTCLPRPIGAHTPELPAASVLVRDGVLELRLGGCSVVEPIGSDTSLAVLAGPDWITIERGPPWEVERWYIWPIAAAVVIKVLVLSYSLGASAALVTSATLAVAAVYLPVPATLTWPLTIVMAFAAAFAKISALVWRKLPPRRRWPAAVAVVLLFAGATGWWMFEPGERHPIVRSYAGRSDGPDLCALIGYSTVESASLRKNRGGIRDFLAADCAPCAGQTAVLAAGGETLEFIRDEYCRSSPGLGADGQVIFFGGANDDYLSGITALAQIFLVGQQGIEPWRQTQRPAAAASLAALEVQLSALREAMVCAAQRRARFVFIHDFLVSDLVDGRGRERTTMLESRRQVVEAAGGIFIDTLERFAAEAGVSWFNDYIHPSMVAHRRIAEAACAAIDHPLAANPPSFLRRGQGGG